MKEKLEFNVYTTAVCDKQGASYLFFLLRILARNDAHCREVCVFMGNSQLNFPFFFTSSKIFKVVRRRKIKRNTKDGTLFYKIRQQTYVQMICVTKNS